MISAGESETARLLRGVAPRTAAAFRAQEPDVRVDERAERIEEAARRLVALDPVTCASWALGAGFNELRGALDD